jgi:formylglycine-generating enzyme required for sulfatase activity
MIAIGSNEACMVANETATDATVDQEGSALIPLGISKTKPDSGPFVELKNGTFMVPYRQKVESTDVSFEMIPIPGGEFVMGSPENEPGRNADEGPQFTVQVEPFWMAKTELTWAEYKTFMKTYDIFKRLSRQGIRKVVSLEETDAITIPTPLYEPSHTYEYGDDKQQPAVTMTQYAAKQYTKWLSGLTQIEYRLPTESEWEYAARAGSSAAYSFGDNASELLEYASFAENSPEGAPKVGSKKPNAFGLHDLHGSVWEWTIDQYSADGYGDRAGKKLTVFEAITVPDNKELRCVRGGGWQDPAERLRSASRMGSADEEWKDSDPNVPLSPWWYTTDPARMVGMRLVRSSASLTQEQRHLFWDVDNPDIQADVDFRLKEGRGAIGKSVPELSEEYKRKK